MLYRVAVTLSQLVVFVTKRVYLIKWQLSINLCEHVCVAGFQTAAGILLSLNLFIKILSNYIFRGYTFYFCDIINHI